MAVGGTDSTETVVTAAPPGCVVITVVGTTAGTVATMEDRPPVASVVPIAQGATLSLSRTLSADRTPVTAMGIAGMIRENGLGRMPGTVDVTRIAEFATTQD